MVDEAYWIFDSYEESQIDGNLIQTMKTSGNFKSSKYGIDKLNWADDCDIFFTYTSGIGLTEMIYQCGNQESKLTYKETITLEEFEKLQVTQ